MGARRARPSAESAGWVVSRPLRRQGAPTRRPGLSGRPASRDLLRRGAPGCRRRALRVAKPAAQAAALSGGGGSVGSGGRRAEAVRRANLRITPPCLRRDGRGLRGRGAGEGDGSVWSGPPGRSRRDGGNSGGRAPSFSWRLFAFLPRPARSRGLQSHTRYISLCLERRRGRTRSENPDSCSQGHLVRVLPLSRPLLSFSSLCLRRRRPARAHGPAGAPWAAPGREIGRRLAVRQGGAADGSARATARRGRRRRPPGPAVEVSRRPPSRSCKSVSCGPQCKGPRHPSP